MNRADFVNMIADGAKVDRRFTGEVTELVNIYPYFQCAHLLLLKGLQNTDDVKFRNQLRNSAIHVADREVLYYLLKSKVVPDSEAGGEETVNPTEESSGFDTQQTVIESAKNSDYLIDEIEKDSADRGVSEQSEREAEPPGHPIIISGESEIEELAAVMILPDEETFATDDKVFYMDPGILISDQNDLLELDQNEDIGRSEEDGFPDLELEIHDNKDYKKQAESGLIEKFILTNPRIEPNRQKSDLPVEDISMPSVEGEGSFITETLAKIYVSQGYYSKAIDIYEKLCLKFPEKSSYFASQIEKVKEHIKK